MTKFGARAVSAFIFILAASGIAATESHTDCYEEEDNGRLSYVGNVSYTFSGIVCQDWRSNSPHNIEENWRKNYTGNVCRNPDDSKRPWCYTLDEDTVIEYCPVPMCGSDKILHRRCYEAKDRGQASYMGAHSKTVSGRTCQHWYKQKPHRKADIYFGIFHNFCRNPEGKARRPWCFTSDPEKRWEYCDIPECGSPKKLAKWTEPNEDCYDTYDKGVHSYIGTKSTTTSGRQCQQWNVQSPHRKDDSLSKMTHNYCRNADGRSDEPWCFTNDVARRWEPCGVPACENKEKCTDTYTGNQYTAGQEWTSQSDGYCFHFRCTPGEKYTDPYKTACADKRGKCVQPSTAGVMYKCDESAYGCRCKLERGRTVIERLGFDKIDF